MKILIRDIPQDGSVLISEEISADFLGLESLGAKALSGIHCSLDVGLSGGGLFATGQLSLAAELTCVACLEPFEMLLEVPGFATQIELSGSEIVDLTDSIREDILLTLPAHPRCDRDGMRVCSANFPTAPGAPLTEEPPVDSSAWNALDQIKPKL